MADSSVPITAGSGTNIDTRTAGNGDHRQVVVLGNDGDNVATVADGGVGVNGGGITSTTGAIAAGATGTVGPLDVSFAGNVSFIVKNTVAASAWAGAPVVVFEQSDDNVSWAALPVVRNETGQYASTFTLGPGVASGALIFECGLEAVNYVRARVTTGPTTNGFTIDIQCGGMPFAQGSTVLAVPTDGARATYINVNGINASTPHLVTTGAWLALPNSSTTKVFRVLRARFELTIATAAMLTLKLYKSTGVQTGGTLDAGTSTGSALDSGDPAATGQVNVFTAAPTGGITLNSPIGWRRIWTPVATAAGAPAVIEVVFGSGKPDKALVLRNNQTFSVYWGAAPATAVTANFEIEWTEEPA